MEKNIYKGNILIRRLVVLVDFIILNCLLLGFINFEFIHVPDYLDLKTKITFYIANVALAIGEYNYCTIIHVRRMVCSKYSNVLSSWCFVLPSVSWSS